MTPDMRDIALGIKALRHQPGRAGKHGRRERDVTVGFGGVEFVPGDTPTAADAGLSSSRGRTS